MSPSGVAAPSAKRSHSAGGAAAEREVQRPEGDERGAVLLHQHGRPEREPGGERPRPHVGEQQHASEHRQDDEVLGVGGEAVHRGAERQHGPRRRGDQARGRIEERPPEAGDEQRRGQVDDQEPESDGDVRLAEDAEDGRIGVVDPRQLHVVRGEVRHLAVQDQLTHVGVLALVTLERDVEQAEPEERRGQQDGAEHERLAERRRRSERGGRGFAACIGRAPGRARFPRRGVASVHGMPARSSGARTVNRGRAPRRALPGACGSSRSSASNGVRACRTRDRLHGR